MTGGFDFNLKKKGFFDNRKNKSFILLNFIINYMPDSFNIERAAEEHENIIREIQRIRDSISKDVIDYYYNNPETKEEEKTKREGMRKYLLQASERIDDLLKGRLY